MMPEQNVRAFPEEECEPVGEVNKPQEESRKQINALSKPVKIRIKSSSPHKTECRAIRAHKHYHTFCVGGVFL